jgi:hypothetical protein
VLPLVLLRAGHREESRALARATLAPPFNGIAAYVLGVTGDRARATAIIRQLEAWPRADWFLKTTLTYAYLGVGDTTRALSAMEAAAVAGERPFLPFLDPMFDPLRPSARFAAAVRRFGLDERLIASVPAPHQ